MCKNRREFLLTLWILIASLASGLQPAAAVPAEGHRILYAGPSPYGAEIARDVFKTGGNAVDAAVAIGLSLAVTHPYYAAFGGGGFALVKSGKTVAAIDFREKAPGRTSPETFKDRPAETSLRGGLAVAVPGFVAGLWELHHKYGHLKWAKLFETALKQAERGFHVSGEWVDRTVDAQKFFNDAGKKIFFRRSGDVVEALKPGDLLKQPGLAKFLRRFRQEGPSAFYRGAVARELEAAVKAGGGVLSLEDLKNYRVRWLEPITTEFAGYKIYLMPPPSSGGIVIAQALQLIDRLKLKDKKPLSVDEYHLLAETMKLAFRGRSLLGDPDFAKNPVQQLLDPKYLDQMADLVKLDKSVPVEPLQKIEFEHENTTHFSVMDEKGNTVALTVTLNGDYGSGLVTPDSGIALNNEMDDFTTQLGRPNMFGLIQGEANLVRAGARPLSSMSPTIVEKDGATVLSVGAPGGSRIITGVLQVLYRVLQLKWNIDLAIQSPRVHHQFLPDIVFFDEFRFSPEVIEGLEKRGHRLQTGFTARVAGVARDPVTGILSGAADARGEAAAGGL